jgi:hypothetical protein
MTSPIDQLFEEIYGYKPTKSGEAYELLASAVAKLISKTDDVAHDKKLRGLFSQTLYQIDVLIGTNQQQLMGEAKDYTERASKVGRGDLQKLGGALNDLEVSGGVFYSATDYTGPAKKYAQAAGSILGKDITLYHLRPSTELDEEGRIKTICIQMKIYLPEYHKAKFEPVWSEKGKEKIINLITDGHIKEGDNTLIIEEFFDEDGQILTTIHDLTSRYFGGGYGNNAIGSFFLPGAHVKIDGHLVGINGITYDVPFSETIEEIVFESNGSPKLLIKDEKGNINRLLTDEDLRKVRFTDTGKADVL